MGLLIRVCVQGRNSTCLRSSCKIEAAVDVPNESDLPNYCLYLGYLPNNNEVSRSFGGGGVERNGAGVDSRFLSG